MRPAAIRLRFLAGLVDAGIFLAAIAAVVGLVIGGLVGRSRLRRSAHSQQVRGDDQGGPEEEDDDDEQEQRAESEPAEDKRLSRAVRATATVRSSQQLRAAFWGVSAGLAVVGRNWRSPGFRVFALRRVDARTGGTVSVRSALAGVLFEQARQAATNPLTASLSRRSQERLRSLEPRLKALEREHAGDPEAALRARMEFYEANDVRPSAGCGWPVAVPLLSQLVLALGIRDGRTVRDRVTGTVVIVDQ